MAKNKKSNRRSKKTSPKKRSYQNKKSQVKRRSIKKVKKPRRGKHSTKKSYGCKNLSHLKKYRSGTRKSPPYPANECGGLVKVGRDGKRYKSKKNVRGIYQWRLV